MLTALSNLLEKYEIDPMSIGRLEVGTETLIDKSKSVKTSLMGVLGLNSDVEGVTSTNACYGGTAALFNSLAWVQSEEWDGRYAVVLAGDIAVYAAGPARPTSGCGVVAMLIGPDAPLPFESGLRATHAIDCYDFYKPSANHNEYALVDGKLSQSAYLTCVDKCYQRYVEKAMARTGEVVTASSFDYLCFHSPYHKLVQKGYTRLAYMDYLKSPTSEAFAGVSEEMSPASMTYEKSLESRDLDAAFRPIAAAGFSSAVGPTSYLSKNIGNCYTGAVFFNLLSLVNDVAEAELLGKRVGMFSYGSGSVATLYSIRPREPTSGAFTLGRIAETTAMRARLDARIECTPEEFAEAMGMREEAYDKAPHTPAGPTEHMAAGTYYLAGIDEQHRRTYERV
mmetsp:Transcript_104832/g.302424  ORF Transcript_104832/g.302424 Transcript_104832/m.302424 type:complete len:395 (-) Transcript_104832:879-2063(-)